MESSLTDANHRHCAGTACSIQSRIVETSYDAGIGRRMLLHFADHARNSKNLIEVTFYAGWAVLGIDGYDIGIGRCYASRGFADFTRHGSGRIRVDDKYVHFLKPSFFIVVDGLKRVALAIFTSRFKLLFSSRNPDLDF